MGLVKMSPRYNPPFWIRPYVAVPECPRCRKPLRDHITGLPVNCECRWPTALPTLRYEREGVRGAGEVS